MIRETDCFYCTKDSQLQSRMIEIKSLQASTVYLNRDQAHKGRCIVAFHEHVTELFHLSKQDLHSFMEDISTVGKAIDAAFQPDKINYAIYGDLVSHLHFHLVPKYKEGKNWGEAFDNSPSTSPSPLSEKEYQEIIKTIEMNL